MTYIPVQVSHRGNSDWEAYLPTYDDFVYASSKPKVEEAAYQFLERAYGLREFHVTWLETP